jgi:hypothetical protein
MARSDPLLADRTLAVARRVLRVLLYTLAVCVGVGLSVLVLVGVLVATTAVTGSRTLGSFAALVAFGLVIALPVYWLVARDGTDDRSL